MCEPEEELGRLQLENTQLRAARDFFRKTAAFFAKESQ